MPCANATGERRFPYDRDQGPQIIRTDAVKTYEALRQERDGKKKDNKTKK